MSPCCGGYLILGHISWSESALKLCPLFGPGNWTFSKVFENDCNLLVLKLGSRYTPIQAQKMGFALVCFLSAGAFLRPESGHNFGDQRHNLVTRKSWPPTRKIHRVHLAGHNLVTRIWPQLCARFWAQKKDHKTKNRHCRGTSFGTSMEAQNPAPFLRDQHTRRRDPCGSAASTKGGGRCQRPQKEAAAGGRRRRPKKMAPKRKRLK